MKIRSKVLLVLLSAMALVASSMFGTMAYLTDSEGVTNTFTVGNVGLKLDEAKVDANGKAIDGEERVKKNDYHLLPGYRYDKDPTVTVDAGSEASYVRILMTIYNADAVQAIIDADDVKDEQGNLLSKGNIVDYADLFSGWQETVWVYEGCDTDADSITFEFRYHETVDGESGPESDGVLEPLFTELVVPEYVTKEQLSALYGTAPEADSEEAFKGEFKIEIVAHAMQAAGFEENEDAAWSAFGMQMTP